MKLFELHWLDNTTEVVEGESILDAIRKAGYGAGAMKALDFYKEIKNDTHEENTEPDRI